MRERGLSKDEAFMVETAAAADVTAQHKVKKEKHKAAFGKCIYHRKKIRNRRRRQKSPKYVE